MLTPDVIFLIHTGDQISWCDDVNPSGDIDINDTTKYVKSSICDALIDAIDVLISDAEFFSARLGNEEYIESIKKDKELIKLARRRIMNNEVTISDKHSAQISEIACNYNINEFICGQRDCRDGKPHSDGKGASYDAGYSAQYTLEQINGAH